MSYYLHSLKSAPANAWKVDGAPLYSDTAWFSRFASTSPTHPFNSVAIAENCRWLNLRPEIRCQGDQAEDPGKEKIALA
jgi:hypothetical protein